jgi:formate hydrogenlyase subunit 3/multisubunit Na+/H+ antiporter MnhD subunit
MCFPAFLAAGVLFAVVPLVKYSFPPYNFVWGEYQREYEKKKGRRRFVLAGVVLTITLGILANVLTRKLGL